MGVYATGVVIERGEEKGYYLIHSETQEQKFIKKSVVLENFRKNVGIFPVSNLVLADDELKAPWQERSGLPRYDRGGHLIGSNEIEKGVYLTMNIITENCEPPIGIGHWEVQVFKEGFLQGLSGYEAVQSGFTCIQKIMSDEMPVDSEILSIMNIMESTGGEYKCNGIRFHLELSPRGLLAVKVTDVTPAFNGKLLLDIKCKALLQFDTSDFPDLVFDELVIGPRVGQICKGAFAGVNITKLSVRDKVRYTLAVVLETNAKIIDLSHGSGLLEEKKSASICDFPDRTEKLIMPENSSLVVYPSTDNYTLKELQLGKRCGTNIERQVERYVGLEKLLIADSNTVDDAIEIQRSFERRHMRNVKIARFDETTSKLAIEAKDKADYTKILI